MLRALLALSVIVAGCFRNAAFASDADTMKLPIAVELDIYSGVPNPKWSLSAGEAETLLSFLAAAKEPAADQRLQSPLGYRGFIANLPGDKGLDIIRVQNGAIHITSGNKPDRVFKDTGRRIERFLLETAKPHIGRDIGEIVERSF